MAESDFDQISEAFAAERPTYEALTELVEGKIGDRLEEAGIYAPVKGRAKEVESFAIKALVGDRYTDPLRQIGDKAGLRITVPYLHQIDEVETLVRDEVTVIDREQKLDALAYDQVGYLGVHLDCRLKDEDLAAHEEFKDYRFEVQLRTNAQSAWAEVAHEQLYKPPAEVPPELKRRIYRLVSLVELFDNEVEAFLFEASNTPGFKEAVALKPLTLVMLKRFGVRRRPDRALSLLMAAALVPLYGQEPDEVAPSVEEWAEDQAEKLQQVFDEAQREGRSPLLLQPEALLLFNLLERDPDAVLEHWPEQVPVEWLREAAGHWQVRLPDTESQVDARLGD